MKLETQELIETLLLGEKKESKQAKDKLIKEIETYLKPHWSPSSSREFKKKRKIIKEEMLHIYEKLFSSYKNIKNHNKCYVLAFLGHALFCFEESHEYFKIFLDFVIEALADTVDGNLRQSAVLTATNIYTISTMDLFESTDKKVAEKQKISYKKYENIMMNHITQIFNKLEIIIEKDPNNFPVAIDKMKSSSAKSYLLYLSSFDRRIILQSFLEIFDSEPYVPENEYKKIWHSFYKKLFKTHPNIKNFIKHVPRFDLNKYEDYEEKEYQDISEMVNEILNATPKDILSPEFFIEENDNVEDFLGGFSIPTDAYFEISDIVQVCDNKEELLKVFKIIYPKAEKAEVSEIYWYDLLAFILSKLGNHPLRLKTLKEAIDKLLPKIDIKLPLHVNSKNDIHYGIHEQRPIFRILIAYAIYHHDNGDKEIAKQYYEFLLKLNPNDNQGVRYLLATLYAGKHGSYTDHLFDEGNKKQNWDKLENFLSEQNSKHHFWQIPE